MLDDVIRPQRSRPLDRDVLVQTGVTHVIAMAGLNDITFEALGFQAGPPTRSSLATDNSSSGRTCAGS